MKNRFPTAGRAWAYVFLAAGLGVSLAANMAAAYIGGREPTRVDIALASAPPVVVFGIIEVLARNPWPHSRVWRAIRWAASIFVAIPAAAISFIHLVRLVLDDHPNPTWVDWAVAIMTPLMVDGLLAGCTAALLIPATHKVEPLNRGLAITAHGESVQILQREIERLLARPPQVVTVEKIIEVPVEKIVYRERPATQKRTVSRETGAPQQRYRAEDHPLWSAWRADYGTQTAWDVERMRKELRASTNPEATDEAARALLNRWTRKVVADDARATA